MISKNSFISIIFFCIICSNCYGKILEGKGDTVFPFLKINPSVNSAGVAASNAATITGMQSIFLNPAGLATVNNLNMYFQYTKWLDEINLGYVALGKAFKKKGVMGISAGYLQYPDQKQTVLDGSSPYNYTVVDSFSAASGFLGTYISGKLGRRFLWGAGVKLINQMIGSFKDVSAFGVDLGLISLGKDTKYGISVNNLSVGAKYGESYESLPYIVRIGGEWKYNPENHNIFSKSKLYEWQYIFKFCSEIRYNEGIYFKGGLEVLPYKFLAFRAGYSYALETDELGGIGGSGFGVALIDLFKRNNLDIEYALNSLGRLGFVHRIGVNLAL